MARYYDGERWVSDDDQEAQGVGSALDMWNQGYFSDLGALNQGQYTSGAGGQSFPDTLSYLNYLYGGNITPETVNGETWYKVDNLAQGPQAGATPISYNPPPSMGSQLALGAILGLAGSGLTGMLPGTENVFSGLGGGFPVNEASILGGGDLGTLAQAAGEAGAQLGSEFSLAGAAGATPSVATPSVATLPDSYWSMLADAGTGAVTDAGAVGAGTVGSDFSLAGATAGNPAGGLYSGASGLGLNPASAGLGFTPSDALVSGMANGTSNALLTPAIAGAAGIPAAASTATNFLTGAQQAIPTAAESIGGAATAATTPATTAAGATPAAAGSAFSRLIDGTATASDWASVLGTVGATGLGLAGANAQANALKDVYNQQMTLGQPYRDRLNASYQPGFNLAQSDPAYQGALDTAAQAAARATSAQSGNPVGNPGAYAEMQKYITNSTALPYLQNYRSQLGTFGQLGTNTAGAAALGGAQSQGGTYNALGYGLGQLTQPDNPFKGLLSQFGKSGFSF